MNTQSDMLYFNNIKFLYGVSIFNDSGENLLYSLLLITTTFKKNVPTSVYYQFHAFTDHLELWSTSLSTDYKLLGSNLFKVVLYLPSIHAYTELCRLQVMTSKPLVAPQGLVSRVIGLLPGCFWQNVTNVCGTVRDLSAAAKYMRTVLD